MVMNLVYIIHVFITFICLHVNIQLTRITKKDIPKFILSLLFTNNIYEKNIPNITQQTSVVILIPFEFSFFTSTETRYATHNIIEININIVPSIPPISFFFDLYELFLGVVFILSISDISIYCYKIGIYKNLLFIIKIDIYNTIYNKIYINFINI